MKLEDKGRFVPRPVLSGPSEELARTIEGWDEVHARTHWNLGNEQVVDGADFYVGTQELGHIHLYAEAHIAVPRRVRDALIAAGVAEAFPWSQAFVTKRIRGAKAADEARWIFGLAYDGLRGATVDDLVMRVEARKAA